MHQRHSIVVLVVFLFVSSTVNCLADDDFRPTPGKFPPLEQSKVYRGELVFVDHINRRGRLRLYVDDYFREGKLHYFAMLPYGVVRYRGAPADLRDIPIGTTLYGRFFLAPKPETAAVPLLKNAQRTRPRETHAILLEDGPSLCLREGVSWEMKEVDINGNAGHLIANLNRTDKGEGLSGEKKLTIDSSTRIWRGRESLTIQDLIDEGIWPAKGRKKLNNTKVQLALEWHPEYLYQKFHVSDIWLDEAAMKTTANRQRQRHIRHIRMRWMPAFVDAVEHGRYGKATVHATLFGGMAKSLYADFKPNIQGKMAAAEDTLRTWWQDHDGMDGKIVSVEKPTTPPPVGSSGIRIRFEVPLVLEGFRPGLIVRVRPQSWPNVNPPYEERVKGLRRPMAQHLHL